MEQRTNPLIGYWVIEYAPLGTQESQGNIFLRFTERDLLQWGYSNQRGIVAKSFQYSVEGTSLATVRPPQPRIEHTPFTISSEGKLTLAYSYYETKWARAEKQDFFESKKIWDPGDYYRTRLDYLHLLKELPHGPYLERARLLEIDPQVLVNTQIMGFCWAYSHEPFAFFHLDDFEFILSQGVLIDDDDNEDRTLLSYLAQDGLTDAVRVALDYGADINHMDIYPETALDYASSQETIQLLRDRGGKLASELL